MNKSRLTYSETCFNDLVLIIRAFVDAKMAGRPRKIEKATLLAIFETNQAEIICNGSVIPPSAPFWHILCSEQLRVMKSKAVYTEALRWWREKNLPEIDEHESETGISMETSVDMTSSQSTSDKKKSIIDIQFSIRIPIDKWTTIQPVPLEYKRKLAKNRNLSIRTYLCLPPGIWTNVIADEIAKHPKNIVCTVAFKRAKVYSSGNAYITMAASCTTCIAFLTGIVKEEPLAKTSSVKIQFVLRNFNEAKHRKSKNVKNYGAGSRGDYAAQTSSHALHLDNVNKTTEMSSCRKGANSQAMQLGALNFARIRRKNCPHAHPHLFRT